VKPVDALSPGHVDPSTAEVTFAGIAVNGVNPPPAWDRTSATCSSTYCHGATMGGSTPVWTRVGQGEAACGTCHGAPPPTPHPAVPEGLSGCSVCHNLTIDGTGQLIPPSEGGAHLNGILEASGHDALWMDTSDPTFHAYSVNRNLQSCTGCHGAALDGGAVGVGCGDCHDRNLPAGVASWSVNCVMCHGGGDNQTGAPPKATWGNAGDSARGGGIADPLRVGAHSKHLSTTLTTSVTCSSCHVVPAQALAPAHAVNGDSIATVTWSGVALTGGAAPQWNRSAGTCATTYCHGSYSGVFTYGVWDWGIDDLVFVDVPYAGKNATPGWTDGPLTCGSCHGNPPSGYWHSATHGSSATHRACETCHPDATGTNAGGGAGITLPGRHIDGKLDVTPKWGGGCGCH
jgi:predicted CxxxxCH...CXXCH cytochrome family protein